MRLRWLALLSILVPTGCAETGGPGGDRADCVGGKCDSLGGLDAVCTANVRGAGRVDVELEYLPRVIACENGDGGPEALKAQAIAARSYLYYVINTEKRDILDGEGDQVYRCSRKPSSEHFAAVEATSGMVLQYRGTQVASFFVAGASQSGPTCRGGSSDPTNTERFVTYNEGLSGTSIHQSTLGSTDPSNHANRGCMSQLGANCLDNTGSDYEDILRFYYGEDIEVVQASGGCIVDGPIDPPNAGPWIGDSCEVHEQCDFFANGEQGLCYSWFNEDNGQLGGFCSVTCEGFCPDDRDHAPSMCVDVDAGRGFGRCLAEAAPENSNCRDIPGTEIRVMERYVGDTNAPVDVEAMCAPPHAPKLICDTGSQLGECIDTGKQTCSGQLHSNLCPGNSDIRCCTP